MSRFLLLGLALAAMLLAACGGSNPHLIPSDRADALSSKVDEIGQKTSGNDCTGAEQAVQEARNQVLGLPAAVSSRLRANLLEWVNHAGQQVPKDCQSTPKETPTPSQTAAPTDTPSPSATPDKTSTPTPSPSATDTPAPDQTPDPAQPPSTGGVTPGNGVSNGNG
jgi:hypothetical protein